ncbi:LOW QUALITY PROTEIN: centrosomal protein kizuna [Lagopus leucura]|uniref:LOW QUALITY PROTEIN: centrosomal protein kizuna n=1 Tax=Lagopus leucura TaxID=30410 RepID=UPI001C67FA75|nr:LOW QUALITY PROTEIN: centrosomal protein kizuna [Lagopus leucura]
MSGAGPAAGGPHPESSPPRSQRLGGLLRCLRESETRRLELERKLLEYKSSDAYLMKLKYVKLKKYLEEVNERQKKALLRNQAFLNEFNEFEAQMKASSSELIEKMEVRCGREIKSGLLFQEGGLARGDKEEGCSEQMPQAARQAGIHAETAVSRSLHHPLPFFVGHCMSACSVQQEPPQSAAPPSTLTALQDDETDGHLMQAGGDVQHANKPDEQGGKSRIPTGEKMPIQDSSLHSSLLNFTEQKNSTAPCSTLPDGGSVQSRTADLVSDTSVDEVVTHEHLVASAKEVCEQPVLLASASEPSVSGPRCNLNTQQAASQASSSSSSTHPAENSSLQPPSCSAAEDEPLGSSVPDGSCSQDGSLKEDVEASEAAVLCQLPRAKPGEGWDVATLQASLKSHAAFLEEHEHLCTEELAAVSHSTLDSGEETPGSQAPLLLREVLAEQCGDGSSVQSNESSYSLPSIPNDGREMEQAKHVPWLDSMGKQGCGVGNNGSEAKERQEMCSESSSSSERSGDLSRPEFRKGAITAIKSKAFWGESDDSSSEAVDVLRPQTHSPEADDFDDFYD